MDGFNPLLTGHQRVINKDRLTGRMLARRLLLSEEVGEWLGSIPARSTNAFNPYTMETIFLITVGLLIVAAFAVGHTVRKHNKMFKDNEDPVPNDMPARYDDVQYCERPYIEML